MDYYEELGVDPSATDQEIRRARRRLTRLFHPDRQTDIVRKHLAEMRMRRLNAVVDVLLDPERRRLYDQSRNPRSISANYSNYPHKKRSFLPNLRFSLILKDQFTGYFRALPWWAWSTLGALVLAIGEVWLWAGYFGVSFQESTQVYVPVITGEHLAKATYAILPGRRSSAFDLFFQYLGAQLQSAKENEATVQQQTWTQTIPPKATRARRTPPIHLSTAMALESPLVTSPGVPVIRSAPPVLTSRKAAAALSEEKAKAFDSGSAPHSTDIDAIQTSAIGTPKLAAAPLSKPIPAAMTTSAALVPHPLVGEWIYSPQESEKPVAGLYPAEFIVLKLSWSDGTLHGKYRARYKVPLRSIRPEVNFSLVSLTPDLRKFGWESSDGSKGILKIKQMDPHEIKIEWKTTVTSTRPRLVAGKATLIRQMDKKISE